METDFFHFASLGAQAFVRSGLQAESQVRTLMIIALLLAAGALHASDDWVSLNNTHGWSINYPASWEAYVMQAPDSGRELSVRESDNVNFSGPKDCYERKERCGIFHISLDFVKANQQFDLAKYVDGETHKVISKEAGQLDGMPTYFIKLPEDQRLVIVKYKGSIFRISYGPNDHKPIDKTLDEVFNRMMSTLKFKR